MTFYYFGKIFDYACSSAFSKEYKKYGFNPIDPQKA